jgi:hypothetical protein
LPAPVRRRKPAARSTSTIRAACAGCKDDSQLQACPCRTGAARQATSMFPCRLDLLSQPRSPAFAFSAIKFLVPEPRSVCHSSEGVDLYF